MADALLNLEGNAAATVIVVDWRGGSQPPYGQAVANIRLVGVITAHLIHNIYVSHNNIQKMKILKRHCIFQIGLNSLDCCIRIIVG